jgi:selenocysteine lyase/cysteine desulfurase
MTSLYAPDFGPFDGKVWLNCAHQGPLPRVAVEQAEEAIAWKVAPFNLTTERFGEVPRRLRAALGELIGAPADDVILANSASYGLHLLANGIPWRAGDEVLLMKGDFPSDILPWLALEKKGVRIRFIEPRQRVIQADELEAAITPATRLLCTTWVHSLSGYAIDLDALGEVCRAHGVLFVANGSQAIGARPLDVSRAPVDAITSVGFKWLVGPYGTGFCWIRPELREALEYNQAYWLSMQTADDLGKENAEIRLRTDLGARKYDVFGTANFFNFKPWTASVRYVLEQGVETIRDHDQRLVSRLIDGLDPARYDLLSPRDGPRRSTLVFISRKDRDRNQETYESLRNHDIYVAYRAGSLRVAPHLYIGDDDIDRALSVLNAV